MYKVPSRNKKAIANSLKQYLPLIHNLKAKGKTTEEDARILLNDILSDVLGYDKYNELCTEYREKNDRIDYAVKLTESPNSRKKKFDFVVEAKAAHRKLTQSYVDQTLSYCLKMGLDFFILTNAVKWQLYKVKRSKNSPNSILIHEVNFGTSNCIESLAEEFYLFSKNSYLNNDWKSVTKITNAISVNDVAAVLLSEKIIRAVTKRISEISGIKVNSDFVKDIVESQIIKSSLDGVNKKLLRKLNTKPKKTRRKPKLVNQDDIITLRQIHAPVHEATNALETDSNCSDELKVG